MSTPSPTKPNITLGLATFGPDTTGGARITSLSAFTTILDTFQSHGYTSVDTSRLYVNGHQESFTRAVGWKSRGLSLATKHYPTRPGAHSPAQLRAALEMSLRELGTEGVDTFYLHAADRSIPFSETLREVDALYREGKFSRFGLSNFAAAEVAEVVLTCHAHGWVRPTVYQGMYNALTRTVENELLPACRRYGLAFVGYNPLAGGLLSGAYKDKTPEQVPETGRFSDANSMGATYRARYFKDSTFEALASLQPVVAAHGLTMVETALRWVVHHSALDVKNGGNDVLLIGVSSLAQLEENLAAVEKGPLAVEKGPLPVEVVEALDGAWEIARGASWKYWHGELEYGYDTEKVLFG